MKMVDVGAKEKTERVAVATAHLSMKPSTVKKLRAGTLEKGDALAAAKLAAVMAAKKTPDFIPLCHPLALTAVEVALSLKAAGLDIRVTVKTRDRTGVEMEALTAAAAAALTVYDMCKRDDRGMVLTRVQLEEKSGGRTGDFRRQAKQR